MTRFYQFLDANAHMDWISDFQLFLFDFDGLLVNTEHLHYQAYLNALDEMGYRIELSFGNFLELAHFNSTAWKEALIAQIPELESNWKTVYSRKTSCYLDLVASGKIELMPGVSELLKALEKADIRRCVVTNSFLEQTLAVRANLQELKTIPHWITREDYLNPKPSPECYLKAIEMYGKKGDQIIGFEDSVRGLSALNQTPVLPVLICSSHYPLLDIALEKGGIHFESISKIRRDLL